MKQPSYFIIAAVLLLLHAAFFIYGISNGNIFLKDSTEYLNQAHNLLNYGSWYCGNWDEPLLPQLFSQRTPLYGFFILLFHLLSNSNVIISFAQSLLSLFNIFIAYRILKSISPPTLNPFLILLPFLFFPSQFIYANMLMSEMLLQSFVMLAVYFLLDYSKNKLFRSFIFYQFVITAALLTKPVFVFFPLISFVMFLIIEINIQSKLRSAAVHLIPLAAIIIVSYTNYQQTRFFEYSSIPRKQSINYLAYYSSSYNYGNAFAQQQIDSIERAAALLTTYAEKARFIESGAMNIIANNAGACMILSLNGIANFFLDHCRYDLESFTGNIPVENKTGWKEAYKNDGMNGILNYVYSINIFYFTYLFISLLFNLILIIGLFLFSKMKVISPYVRIILLAFILYTAFMTGMTGTTRFRLPVFLLIVIVNVVAWKKIIPVKKKINSSVTE